MSVEQIEQAVAIVASATPEALAESLALLGAMDPDAATRAEVALRLLTANPTDKPFWTAVLDGFRGDAK